MPQDRTYYEAYDERYRTAHGGGLQWFAEESSPIVAETIARFGITREMKLLELGCGEGRDARALFERGYDLLATDVSPEAVRYCREKFPAYRDGFRVLDCVKGALSGKFDFIYAVAVVHMLVLDEDRDAFYRFIREHLTENGIALICTMGDGQVERQSDIRTAFEPQEREHDGRTVLVAGTSCRMVSDETFGAELARSGLEILERGQTAVPGFSDMMYAVVRPDPLRVPPTVSKS